MSTDQKNDQAYPKWEIPKVGVTPKKYAIPKPQKSEEEVAAEIRQRTIEEMTGQLNANMQSQLDTEMQQVAAHWKLAVDFSEKFDDAVAEQIDTVIKYLLKIYWSHERDALPEAYGSLIQKGLSQLPITTESITIYSNEADSAMVQAQVEALNQGGDRYTLEVDNHLTSGEVRLATEDTQIDLTIKNLLDSIWYELKGSDNE